jgi:hypothetical protein
MARDTKKMPTVPPGDPHPIGKPETEAERAFAAALAKAIAEGRVPVACYGPDLLGSDEDEEPLTH